MRIYDPVYDEPLLSGQPPLSGNFPVPRGWPHGGCSLFVDIDILLPFPFYFLFFYSQLLHYLTVNNGQVTTVSCVCFLKNKLYKDLKKQIIQKQIIQRPSHPPLSMTDKNIFLMYLPSLNFTITFLSLPITTHNHLTTFQSQQYAGPSCLKAD